ncbi:MAG: methyltransferase family protein [Candidatus Thorarchaeota archaeon]
MLDLQIVGPVTGTIASIDVIVHIYLDIKKARLSGSARFKEPNEEIPRIALYIVTITTLFSFLLVLLVSTTWLQGSTTLLQLVLIVSFDPPTWLWLGGVVLLESGIILHLWARAVRGAKASSWLMPEDHQLVTAGPYSRVRHPSYLSYFLSFIGLFLIIPSVGTAILLLGIPAYYRIAVVEEQGLVYHFGNEYRKYMNRTGRFIPVVKREGNQKGTTN